MKMPVPIVAPTPNIVSENSPIDRFSSPVSVAAPVSATNADTGLRRSSAVRNDALSLMRTHLLDAAPAARRRRS
jgi:hypothetical protein